MCDEIYVEDDEESDLNSIDENVCELDGSSAGLGYQGTTVLPLP